MADKIRLPSSEGGLVRYYDDEAHKSKIMLKPEYVIAIVVIVIVAGIVLSAFGSKLLGA